jgi:hypothetical protein
MDWIIVAHEMALLLNEPDNEPSGVLGEAGNVLTRLTTSVQGRIFNNKLHVQYVPLMKGQQAYS